MWRRLGRIASDARVQRASDGAIAVLLLVASLAEIAGGAREWSASAPLEVALAVLVTLPLAFRRTHPIPVAAVVTAAGIASAAAVAPSQGPFEAFVALVFAVYSIGAHVAGRRSAWATAAIAVSVAVSGLVAVLVADGSSGGDWYPIVFWCVVAWALGRVVRSRDLRTSELERLARELAAERDLRAREAVTVERARIARELHDVIAHNVSVMSVQAAAAGRVLGIDPPAARDALDAIERTGRQTIDEMRRMLGVLRSADDELGLAPQPGLADVESLVAEMRASGLAIDLEIEGRREQLPAGLELSAYRIVQEALTNALKHAGDARARVIVRYTSDAVELEVVDDGSPTLPGDGTGHGLTGMRERVALFGGELEAGRGADGGWSLRARLPLGAT
ncbi:MAG: sensor histidine kinase [Gaiellaceae bacterium]